MITELHFDAFIEASHLIGKMQLLHCSSGNLSWRVDNEVMISATGSWLPNIQKEKIAILDLESGRSLNNVRPSMEHLFHLGVMRQRKDVNVVLHFQSEYATTISCMKEKPSNFNIISEIPYHIGKNIAIVPYFVPGTPQLANAVVEALKDTNACLLSNHGQVVCGKDFESVMERAVFLEIACRIMVQSGMNYNVLSPTDVATLEQLGKK